MSASKRAPFRRIDGQQYADWWKERFDPPGDPFAGMGFYQRGRNNIWVGEADVAGLAGTRVDAVGIHLLRIGRRFWKPTSAAIVTFGGSARAGVVELDRGELMAFLAGRKVPVAATDPRRGELRRGFLVARYHGVPVGCAEWHGGETLMSLIPKSQRLESIDL